jgi:molybdopterin synthase catalytic subunit
MSTPRVVVTAAVLDVAPLIALVSAAGDGRAGTGGVVTFLGLVRDHHEGRQVTHLEYEAYVPMAEKALARIVEEAARQWPDARLAIHHRTGRLGIGEASVAIAAASPHRADAYAASRYAIERIKQIVPIWKHEYFAGGDVWVEGATADPDDEAARARALAIACG